MKSICKIWGIGLLTSLMSCGEQEIVELQPQGRQITATAVSSNSPSVFSRLAFVDKQEPEGGVEITWADGDKFYMEGGNGASAEMAIVSGQGEKTANFAGILTGGELVENDAIAAYYPSSAYNTETKSFDVDFRTITQDCTPGNEMKHLSATYLMTGSGTKTEDDVEVSFVNATRVAMIRFDLTLPQQSTSGLTINEFQIVCDDLKTVGTLSTDGETFTPNEKLESHRQKVVLTNLSSSTTSETTFSVYVNVLPVKFMSKMRLQAILSDETVYWYDVENLTNVELKANNRYYMVRGFLEAQKVGVDYTWYTNDKNATEFEIKDEADLRALSKIVNGMAPTGVGKNTFSGKTIELRNDIDLKVDWVPIGYHASSSIIYYNFRGYFKGNNHMISGIYCDDELITGIPFDAVGFFGVTRGTTIENLTVKGVVRGNKQYVGGLVGRNISGNSALSNIINCRNEIDVYSTYSSSLHEAYTGGIVGYTWGTSIMECSNSGSLQAIDNDARLGGIAGGFSGQSTSNKIMACYNEGIMKPSSSAAWVGGIVGWFYEDRDYTIPLIACFNLSENLLADGYENSNEGGIVGHVKGTSDRKHYVYGCYSTSRKIYGYSNDFPVFESCVLLTSEDKNSKDQADKLNVGISTWNTKEDVVNSDENHPLYCNYHFEVGTDHLIVVGGAPVVSIIPEEETES